MSTHARQAARHEAATRLLDSLDALVRRHRGMTLPDQHSLLHAELITAEVAHTLAMARTALRRNPAIPAGLTDPPPSQDRLRSVELRKP